MKNRIIVALVVALVASASFVVFAEDRPTSTAAYEALIKELEPLNQRAGQEPTLAGKITIISRIEKKLVQFRKDYPGSPEASEAGLQLGMLKHSVGSLQQDTDAYIDAVRYLSEYVLSGASSRQNMAFAHFYLGESYKAMAKFDAAKQEYETVVNNFGDVNDRLTQFTKMSIDDLSTQRRLAVGSAPIPFTVTGTKGETLSLEKYKGKVVLLDFWATWCGPCRMEMPNVKKVYSKYNGKGFEIVGISLDRSRSALENYVAQNKIEWGQYFDGKYWNNEIATQYGVKSIPATFLIDKKGHIRYKSLKGPQLEKAVKELLAENI